jgi:hypothetical protein
MSSANRTLTQYKTAAGLAQRNVVPDSVRGGTLGQAATTSPPSPTDTTQTGSTARPNAGISSVGDLSLGLLSLGVAVAGVLGGTLL